MGLLNSLRVASVLKDNNLWSCGRCAMRCFFRSDVNGTYATRVYDVTGQSRRTSCRQDSHRIVHHPLIIASLRILFGDTSHSPIYCKLLRRDRKRLTLFLTSSDKTGLPRGFGRGNTRQLHVVHVMTTDFFLSLLVSLVTSTKLDTSNHV